jgi:hypothetical protein
MMVKNEISKKCNEYPDTAVTEVMSIIKHHGVCMKHTFFFRKYGKIFFATASPDS